jgi:hypothetical protein
MNILMYLPNELSKSTVRPSGALYTVLETVLVSTAGWVLCKDMMAEQKHFGIHSIEELHKMRQQGKERQM